MAELSSVKLKKTSTFSPVVKPQQKKKGVSIKSDVLPKGVSQSVATVHNEGNIATSQRNGGRKSCGLNFSPQSYCPFGGACHTCPVQAKLKINKPGDKYEKEADKVAKTVMGTHSPLIQRKSCTSCGKDNDFEEIIQTKPVSGKITPLTKGQEAIEYLPEKLSNPGQNNKGIMPINLGNRQVSAGESLSNQINKSRGLGTTLPPPTQKFMENRFGNTFSKVRIHNDTQAVSLNNQINSKAFTLGNDIYFNSSYYNPFKPEGQKLIAHELTHVIQQGGKSTNIQRWDGDDHKLATDIASVRLTDEDVKPLASNKKEFINKLKPYSVSTDYKAKRLMWTGLKFSSGITKGEGPDHGEDGNYSTPVSKKGNAVAQNVKRQDAYIGESIKYFKTFVTSTKKGKDAKEEGLPTGRMDKWDVLSLPGIGAVGGAVAGTLGGYALAKGVYDKLGGGVLGTILGGLTGLLSIPLGFALGTGLGAIGLLGMVTSGLSKRPLTVFNGIFAALGEACHVAQDRGSHWEGVKDHGHDNPKAKTEGWNPDNRTKNPGTGPKDFGGWKFAVDNTKKVFTDWASKIKSIKAALPKKKKK